MTKDWRLELFRGICFEPKKGFLANIYGKRFSKLQTISRKIIMVHGKYVYTHAMDMVDMAQRWRNAKKAMIAGRSI